TSTRWRGWTSSCRGMPRPRRTAVISAREEREFVRAFSLEAVTAPRLVLGMLLILATWRVALLLHRPPPRALPVQPAPAAAGPAAVDIARIQRAQLFGASAADPSAVPNIAAASDLVLVGVLA